MELKQGEEKIVSLKIKTLVVDPDRLDGEEEEIVRMLRRLIEDDADAISELDQMIDEESSDEMELCTEATVRINGDGCFEIEYPENEDDEQMRCISKIIFHPDSPELVSMTKEGAIRTYLSFEAGKTHICTYDTPFMPFKIYVHSGAVSNRLLDRGYLHLNYVLNFQDNPPQNFILDIEMKESQARHFGDGGIIGE